MNEIAFSGSEGELSIEVLALHDSSERSRLLRMRGTLDMSTADKAADFIFSLIGDGETGLVIDIDGLLFIDSSGLSLLARIHNKLRLGEGGLHLLSSNPWFAKLFSTTGLDRFLSIGEA